MNKTRLPLFFLTFALVAIILFMTDANAHGINTEETKHVFGVHGLSCPFCVIGVKNTFKKIKGVESVSVNMNESNVTVYTQSGICFSNKQLTQIFNDAGFTYHGTVEQPAECDKK